MFESILSAKAQNSQHLTVQAQKELVRKYQEEGCQRSLDALVQTNLKLACKVASRYNHARIDKDDLLSEAVQGIMRAAQKYDLSSNASFATYAFHWCRAFCGRYLESYTKEPRQQSLDRPINDNGGTIASLVSDGSEPIDQATERQQLIQRVRTAIIGFTEGLNEREETIFHLRTVSSDPICLRELGDAFGIGKERVRQIENTLLSKFKSYLLQSME